MYFELPIVPTAQARVRHGISKSGFVTAFKACTQIRNERTLEACLLEHKPAEPMRGAVRVYFGAVLPVSQSVSKKKKAEMLAGLVHPTKKPDIDNLAKQLLDAMPRLQFWEDDKQIVELHCKKTYGETGKWVVNVEEEDNEK